MTGQVLILAEDSGRAGHVVHQWALAHAGQDVRATVVHTGRRALRGLPPTVKQIHLGAGAAGADLQPTRRLVGSLRANPLVAKAVAAADTLVVPDGKAGAGRKVTKGREVAVVEWRGFLEQLADARQRQLLERHTGGAQARTGLAVLIAEAIGAAYRSPELMEAIGRASADLLAASGYRELIAMCDVFATLPATDGDANAIAAILRIAELTLGSGPQPGDAATARAAFDAAMDRVERDELAAAVRLVTLGLRLVFHSELHADGQRSLIVDDPPGVLAPWRESRFGRYVAALEEGGSGQGVQSAAVGESPRIVVLAGAYGSFYQPVLDVLTRAGHTPELVAADDLGPMLKRRDPTEQIVGEWLRLTDPQRWDALPEDRGAARQLGVLAERLAGADVVFADWCDPGAVFASYLAPPGARIVVRMHRVDATKAWAQLVDWRRVDDVLLVSEHVQAFVAPQLAPPGQPLPTRLTVVNNIIDVERYRRPKLPGAHRAIAMVGWGRRVKDPIFAVEILRLLLRDDPSWRLHFIGRDFADSALTPVADYLARFRELTADPQLRDAIVWVGFTRRLEEALDACGFALSTSVVEGWPVGVVEAAASGCVPVIRDWPQVAAHGGARQIYADTPDWVVTTPEEGAARISALADRRAWVAESARSREAADRLSAAGATTQDYLRAILGPGDLP
ncbi:MAG: glycosyltransferase family 4 protein [Tetrasphaera sp.]